MPPKDFIQARETGENHFTVEGQPYLPNLHVDPKGPLPKVAAAAVSVLGLQQQQEQQPAPEKKSHNGNKNGSLEESLTVVPVLGGLSNTLYRVSGLQTLETTAAAAFDSVLVRIFGAQGMIDRDVETSTFAALAEEGHVPPYHGRFGNGRLEGWMEGMRPLEVPELSRDDIILAVADKVARLHTQFRIPDDLKEYYSAPNMWQQLEEWLQQALHNEYRTANDAACAASLRLAETVADEFRWIRSDVFSSSVSASLQNEASVVYCHNDLLAANIMYNETTGELQLIDFEYGGVNYRSFDLANHWNEYASGPPHETVPHYDWLPDERQQTLFCRTYLRAAAAAASASNGHHDNGNDRRDESRVITDITDEQVEALRTEVQAFLLPNHLYWGLWAINQAASEGCEEYDYMRYGMERFKQYYKCKEEWVSSSSSSSSSK